MRWQQLFADLQAQFEQEEAAAERSEDASRARSEVGALRLVDRLRGAVGTAVVLQCAGAGQVSGDLVDVGRDWLLLVDDLGRDVLCAGSAVRSVAGLTRRTAVAEEGRIVAAAW